MQHLNSATVLGNKEKVTANIFLNIKYFKLMEPLRIHMETAQPTRISGTKKSRIF